MKFKVVQSRINKTKTLKDQFTHHIVAYSSPFVKYLY